MVTVQLLLLWLLFILVSLSIMVTVMVWLLSGHNHQSGNHHGYFPVTAHGECYCSLQWPSTIKHTHTNCGWWIIILGVETDDDDEEDDNDGVNMLWYIAADSTGWGVGGSGDRWWWRHAVLCSSWRRWPERVEAWRSNKTFWTTSWKQSLPTMENWSWMGKMSKTSAVAQQNVCSSCPELCSKHVAVATVSKWQLLHL